MRAKLLALLIAWPSLGMAQQLSFTDVSQVIPYTPIQNPPGTVPGGVPVTSDISYIGLISRVPGQERGGYISVGDLLRAAQAPSAAALIEISGRLDRTNAMLTSISNRLNRFADQLSEGIALAGAINVLPPNPGDRFAVSFGGAGYGGVGAGSIAVSARIDESALAYISYARGPTQDFVKGGLGISFK